MLDILQILRDNWLLLLIGQYPSGPLGGIAATLILSVLGIAVSYTHLTLPTIYSV